MYDNLVALLSRDSCVYALTALAAFVHYYWREKCNACMYIRLQRFYGPGGVLKFGAYS